MLPIADILHLCPNLVSLNVTQPSAPNFSSLPTATWPKLTTLCFSNVEEAITCEQIVAIGKRFPSLKILSIYPCQDPQLTHVVLDYYPRMKSVKLDYDGPEDGITYMDEGPQCEDVGITEFSLEVFCSKSHPWRNAISILTQHQKTLECINFDTDADNEPEEIHDMKYVRLKKLCLGKSGWWIPRKAPMLEELTIASRTIRANPEVFDTIPPKLRRLELKVDHAPRLPDIKAAVSGYLHRFAQHSQLKELVIHFQSMTDMSNVLEAIHHLGQLESLKMRFARKWDACDWSDYGMETFTDGLVKGCPRLYTLEINCMGAPSIHSINALKRLEHLEEFAFAITSMAGYDNFWYALQTFKQLKRIRIFQAQVFNMEDIRHLQGQRPDLKIVVDMLFENYHS